MTRDDWFGVSGVGLGIVLVIALMAAWVTHVVVSISAKAWIMLGFGVIVPPVGVIHGVMVWFGFSWV